MELHFQTVHRNYETDFPPKSELRKRKVKELISQLSGQQSFFSQLSSKAKAATEALFRVSHSIKHKKSFKRWRDDKGGFVEAADSLFRDFKNKLVQLSRSPVTRRGQGLDTAALEGHRRLRVFLTAIGRV